MYRLSLPVILVILQEETVICVFNHVECTQPCSVFSHVWSDRMAICVHPCALHHQMSPPPPPLSGGGGGVTQWCVFCCFSRELRPATRLIFPLMNGVRGNCRFHKSARMTVWVSAAERFIVITVRRPLTIAFRRVPRESCVFYNRVAWWNEVERQCEQRWGPFEGHIKLDFMSSSAACVDGDKEGLSGTDSRSVSKVRRWHLFVELWMRYLLLIIDLSLYSGWRATNISLLRLLVSVKAPRDNLDSYRLYINKCTLNWI